MITNVLRASIKFTLFYVRKKRKKNKEKKRKEKNLADPSVNNYRILRLNYMFEIHFLSECTYNSILSDDKIRGINFLQVEGE